MTTWYLFRHALATENKDGYGDEILTARILPVGIPPTERMAEYIQRLPKSVNWSSELLRCRQTTNIISKITGRTFISDARLNEYDNETFEAFRKRIASWLDDLIIEGEYLESQTLDYPKCGELLVID